MRLGELKPMDDERPPSLARGMWLRFAVAALLIMVLSGAAAATLALNKASSIAEELFPARNQIKTPKGLVTPEYGGGPQTFLILGTDRRSGSKNAGERDAAAHSDTILLVRFDPGQGQTSVLSIPRDLMVNIRTPSGQLYLGSKINAAYTIGSLERGTDEGSVLAAETIEREVFPELKGQLNGIIDVNFAGFIKVVDALGCAYVNVDHRYLGGGSADENFSAINLQPGYQKLCYNNALSYVRFRHFDSDLVRVARQQDFLRDLREQVSPEIGSIDRIAKDVGRAIRSNFHASASELILLSKLIAFSQTKPLRQVKFQYANADFIGPAGESFVTSTPELEKATLAEFLHPGEHVVLPPAHAASHSRKGHHHGSSGSSPSPRALDLFATTGESEAVTAALHVPFPFLYPTLQTGPAVQQEIRPYALRNLQHKLRFAYIIVWQVNTIGGYYDFEGTNWLNPPLFNNARTATIDGREYKLVDDGAHIHVIGWRHGGTLYWLTNTLLEDLTNGQMLAIAKSAQPLH
jgi:LCP family protein required for cell wall assembly